MLAELTKADSLTKVADYEKNPDELAGVSGIRSIPSLLLSLWMGQPQMDGQDTGGFPVRKRL